MVFVLAHRCGAEAERRACFAERASAEAFLRGFVVDHVARIFSLTCRVVALGEGGRELDLLADVELVADGVFHFRVGGAQATVLDAARAAGYIGGYDPGRTLAEAVEDAACDALADLEFLSARTVVWDGAWALVNSLVYAGGRAAARFSHLALAVALPALPDGDK